MKPVNQLILHDPDNEQYGDCFRAVIASLMEMPAEQVPHFIDGPAPVEWISKTNQWLASRGMAYLVIQTEVPWAELFPGVIGIYHEIGGPSPRKAGVYHSVVGLDGEVIHDPHPDKTGILEPRDEWQYGFIVAINAGKNRQI